MARPSAGAAGEVLAARILRDKGYTILAANVRSRFGEIDIIAADRQYIAFVEVKTRSEGALYAPREAVTGKSRGGSLPQPPSTCAPIPSPFSPASM